MLGEELAKPGPLGPLPLTANAAPALLDRLLVGLHSAQNTFHVSIKLSQAGF